MYDRTPVIIFKQLEEGQKNRDTASCLGKHLYFYLRSTGKTLKDFYIKNEQMCFSQKAILAAGWIMDWGEKGSQTTAFFQARGNHDPSLKKKKKTVASRAISEVKSKRLSKWILGKQKDNSIKEVKSKEKETKMQRELKSIQPVNGQSGYFTHTSMFTESHSYLHSIINTYSCLIMCILKYSFSPKTNCQIQV